MAKNRLSSLSIETAKPREKNYKLSDGNGAYLYVSATGGKSWRIDYRLNGKRFTATLGKFPEISLLEFREKVAEFRKKLAHGIDPAAEKKDLKKNNDKPQPDTTENKRQTVSFFAGCLLSRAGVRW